MSGAAVLPKRRVLVVVTPQVAVMLRCLASGEAGCSGQPRLQDFNGWPDSPCLLRWHPDSELCPAPGDGPVGLRINSGRCCAASVMLNSEP